MATIESGPLPPPGFGGQLTKITEADRAEIIAQANEVIDFLLNGKGSFTPDGPRKPEVGPPQYDNTVRDLNNFKDSVVTAKQFADDPNHVLDSVADLIDKTIKQLNLVAGDRDPAESDRIKRDPPDLTDPIDRRPPEDRAPTNIPNSGTARGQPITLRTPSPPQTADLGPSPSPNETPAALGRPFFPMQTMPGGTPTPAQAVFPSTARSAPPGLNTPA